MTYIDLQNVTYTYPLADKPSIEDVTLSFYKGKVYVILGANGSGKRHSAILSGDLSLSFSRGGHKRGSETAGKELK